jgi:large subunit ribosomal protein L10
MTREEKANIINDLTDSLKSYSHFYVTDITALNAGATSNLRRLCFKENIKLQTVKNKLFTKAMEAVGIQSESLTKSLKGNSSIMFCESGNVPAKLIKDYRKKFKMDKPILKAAYVEESVYVGNDQLDTLISIKSKNELIADVVLLLQSPIRGVMSALSAGNRLAGALETLAKREE